MENLVKKLEEQIALTSLIKNARVRMDAIQLVRKE